MKPKILGLAGSLRNARYGPGSDQFLQDLRGIDSKDELKEYLEKQTQFRLQDFVDAGRSKGDSFDKIYANIRKLRGVRGLSNSEGSLAAALWGTKQEGCEIDHTSLSKHFPMSGDVRDGAALKTKILGADAIILSSPVYFGDRSSLAQSLVEFISADKELVKSCKDKIFAGLSVGAKRNGGQETSLIYLLLDMVNLNFLVVGNSSRTTSQYGGTTVAGDVGKMHRDEYGIETCIGTGERVGRVAKIAEKSKKFDAVLSSPLRVQLWLLQDEDGSKGEAYFQKWAEDMQSKRNNLDIELVNLTKEEIVRCIACDICPTHPGTLDEYRCIITSKNDAFVKMHEKLVGADAVLLCAYSPEDRSNINSVYQQFIERTRYIRRDNYAFSDLLFAPFVVSELGARQNLHLRMITSAIRHHTIIHHPIIGMINDGQLLQSENLEEQSLSFIDKAMELTVGRLLNERQQDLLYNPVGYEISKQKNDEDILSGRMRQYVKEANELHQLSAHKRVTIKS